MLTESLGLLALGWYVFGLGHSNGQLPTFSFLTLLYFALFSIISIREQRAFWRSRPGRALSIALLADGIVGILIGWIGFAEMEPLSGVQILVIIGYSLLASLIVNDVLKRELIARFWKKVKS
jgi:H+-transporting ATPase